MTFRVIILCLALSSFRCSLSVMNTVPDDYHPSEQLHCTDTYGWPTVDGLGAIALGVFASMLYLSISTITCGGDSADNFYGSDCGRTAFYVYASPIWAFFALYSFSTGYGFAWASECQQAKYEREKWLDRAVEGEADYGDTKR